MYFYRSHLGGLYTSNKKYTDDVLYCEECGDSDDYLGKYKDWKEFIKKMSKSEFDYMMYSLDYLCECAEITEAEFKELNPEVYEFALHYWEEDEDD